MNKDEIYFPWLPNIHRFEQKFLGIPMMTFMMAGLLAIILFAITSQAIASLGGMVLGVVLALIGFGSAVFATTKLAIFHHMILPVYLLKRWQSRNEPPIQLPLIVSGESTQPVVIENWDGDEEGVIE